MPTKQQQQPRNPGEQTTVSQREAEAIKQTSGAAVLATCLGKTFGKLIGSNGFKAYVEATLETAGNPKDPIERMMLEQLLIAHHRIGDLQAEAACAKNPEVAALYQVAAARLMNEFRKTSLAVREYRTPVTSPKVTLVKQQNIAAGDQQIAYVDDKSGGNQREKTDSRSELGCNEPKAITHEQPLDIIPQSTTGGSRQTEPVETRQAHFRRPSTTAGVGVVQPTVDSIDWPENAGR